jgi:ABC-type lipoprotein release transport system permease subunit
MVGVLLVIAFCLLLFYNLKTGEGEISTLRKIGWKLSDLRFQFVSESAVILLVSLLLGNVIAFSSVYYLKNTRIQIALPWDITAKPHFLLEENAIDRIIETNLPVSFGPIIAMLTSVGMFAFFILMSLAIFQRVKKIKPYDMVT